MKPAITFLIISSCANRLLLFFLFPLFFSHFIQIVMFIGAFLFESGFSESYQVATYNLFIFPCSSSSPIHWRISAPRKTQIGTPEPTHSSLIKVVNYSPHYHASMFRVPILPTNVAEVASTPGKTKLELIQSLPTYISISMK